MLRCVSVAVTALVLSLPLAAQVQRNFPADALRADAVFGTPPNLTLDGRAARLAPGARVRGSDNLLVLSGDLVGRSAVVHYTLERTTGLVLDVWLLTPAEAARQPWPTTPAQAQAWTFNPVTQTWIKP